jgi:hypothetical protein
MELHTGWYNLLHKCWRPFNDSIGMLISQLRAEFLVIINML